MSDGHDLECVICKCDCGYSERCGAPHPINIDKVMAAFREEREKPFCREHPKNNGTCIECALNRLTNSLIENFESFLKRALKGEI